MADAAPSQKPPARKWSCNSLLRGNSFLEEQAKHNSASTYDDILAATRRSMIDFIATVAYPITTTIYKEPCSAQVAKARLKDLEKKKRSASLPPQTPAQRTAGGLASPPQSVASSRACTTTQKESTPVPEKPSEDCHTL